MAKLCANFILFNLTCAFVHGSCSTAANASTAENQHELLQLVTVGHRSARDSIHTLSAKMIIEEEVPNKGKVVTLRSVYWRKGDLERCTEHYPGGRVEESLRNRDECKQVGKYAASDGKRAQYGATRVSSTKAFMAGDIWKPMLISFPSGMGGPCDLDRFLELATKSPTLAWDRLDNHKCVRLTTFFTDVSLGEVRLDAWFDPNVNCLVRKRALSWGNIRSESIITEFRQFAGGNVLPVSCKGLTFNKGVVEPSIFATFSDIFVNQPIDSGIFSLPVPHGTIVFDDISNTRYSVDNQWRAISKGISIPREKSKMPQPESVPSSFTQQSEVEAAPRINWLLWASLILLVIGCGTWVYRSLRGSKPS